MSVRISSSFLKAPGTLTAEEHPLLAVKIAPEAAAGAGRRSFHLALLLDVSGSMDGPRIAAVQTTLRLLLDELKDADILTLISYESAAHILARATALDAGTRPTLRAAVDGLRADGGTNLEAALVALRDVATTGGVAPVDGVFVLTDGHINQGLTAASGLTRLLTAAIPGGTPVYTLGFGADHNSRMLRDMALRTRGSYTYADAAELIPATIADIITGLATEVGRRGRLTFPANWTCLELSAEADATEVSVGALIADKEQWVVLQGPPGPTTTMPVVNLVWRSPAADEDTVTALTTFGDFEPLLVAEQFCRCRVAKVQTTVQDLLEARRIDDARAALTALGAELDASPAKDRTFVISLRAQVDEMVDALAAVAAPLPFPPALRAGRAGLAWGSPLPAAAPSLAPILSRMASNTAALGNQNGVLSHINSVDPAAAGGPAAHGGRAGPSGITYTFSSPGQRAATVSMRAHYSQAASAPAAEDEEVAFDEAIAAVAATAAALAAEDAATAAAAGAAATADPVTPPRTRPSL